MKIKLSNCWRPVLLGAALLSQICAAPAWAEVRPLNRVIAIVDNDVIMQSQLDERLREVENTMRQRGAAAPPEADIKGQVLERLILENIQLQLGERAGIRISDDELNHAMMTIAERNGLSPEQFQQALQADGLTLNQVREQIRREMIISRVRQHSVSDRIQVSQQEVQNFLASDLGKMQLSEELRLSNILIPLPETAANDQVKQAEAIARHIYQQLQQGADFARLAVSYSGSENALEGGDMGWRQAAQMPPPFDDMLQNMKPGDFTEPVRVPPGFIILQVTDKRGEQQQVMEEINVRHMLIKPSAIRSLEESKRLAERLRERVLAGEDFGELARKYSEDPGSALNGGNLNWINPEVLVPEFRQVMQNSPENVVSQPFETPYGWHILEVLGRRTTDVSDSSREQQAMNLLRNRKYDDELQSWLRQIRDEAFAEIKTDNGSSAN